MAEAEFVLDRARRSECEPDASEDAAQAHHYPAQEIRLIIAQHSINVKKTVLKL